METNNDLMTLIKQGYIFYSKNGIIATEKAPDFGTITLSYQGGKFTHLTVTTTKK
ncbi:hypothetical protein [Streptococcus equinus]|uniref:hypothetical protein n=1 Tax=Streptococcus equinus TaxID=1335 RepID=UPI0008AD4939|nr:hypothetical protein [Streptococcus equinus]QBX07902.1 hypothetical protein JavanS200_0007 [Streptococcus satellite phage Javan200]SEK38040.1 hypothetical protein SAMN04487838_0822 [Streptococcus equinus]